MPVMSGTSLMVLPFPTSGAGGKAGTVQLGQTCYWAASPPLGHPWHLHPGRSQVVLELCLLSEPVGEQNAQNKVGIGSVP